MESVKEQSIVTLVSNDPWKDKRKYGRTWRQRRRQKSDETRSYTVDSSLTLVSLCQWLKQKGMRRYLGSCLKVAVFSSTGRGLMAVNGVRAGEVVVSIPRQALITCEDVMLDDHLGAVLRGSGKKLKAMEVLTIFLVYHKPLEETSPWRPYLESLPKSYTVPIYCSKSEHELLPTFLKAFADQQEEDINACYINIKEIISQTLGRDTLCIDDVKWAWFTVNTRAVYLKNESPDPILLDDDKYALAPYLDLLNHTPNAQVTTGLNKKNNCYEIVTQVPYGPFEQVFINYGPHDNIRLYREYGFTVPNNPHNSVPVTLDDIKKVVKSVCSDSERISDMYNKCKLLKCHHLDEGLVVSNDGPSWTLVVATTILLMSAMELNRWQVVYHDYQGVQHRKLVLEVLNHVIECKLQELQECLEEMDSVVTCTEAFMAGRNLVRECCMLLREVALREGKAV